MNATNYDTFGTLYMRKPRGRNLTFVLGGPSLNDIFRSVCMNDMRKQVMVWIAHDGSETVEFSLINTPERMRA